MSVFSINSGSSSSSIAELAISHIKHIREQQYKHERYQVKLLFPLQNLRNFITFYVTQAKR